MKQPILCILRRLSSKFLSGAPLEGLSALQLEHVDSLRQSVEADMKVFLKPLD